MEKNVMDGIEKHIMKSEFVFFLQNEGKKERERKGDRG